MTVPHASAAPSPHAADGPEQLSSRFVDVLKRRSGGLLSGLVIVLPALVVIYGAALRLDALTLKYGLVDSPTWLRAVQRSSGALGSMRPSGVTWQPVPLYPHSDGRSTHYISDPYTYTKFAREMRSFYGAHYREPLFPFVTKIFLRLLNDQDIAVSFASTLFSVLAVLATYLLGSYAFSRWVGLVAALAMAIEYELISIGVDGWRDDAFTCLVVMSAYALLRCLRKPSTGNAVFLGVMAAAACLIRITSLSFLFPGFAFLLLAPGQPMKTRLRGVGLAVFTMAALVAPYLVNCWLVFGDPLYSIDYHANVYATVEGDAQRSQTAASFVGAKAINRPMQTLDTAILGLTSYPFQNKWQGFEPWVPGSGVWLSWASLFGLFLLVGSNSGRLLLVVLVASLLPYAFTWMLISDWRFTEHAYPFFLIASSLTIVQAATRASPSRLRRLVTLQDINRARVVFWSLALIGVAAGAWFIVRALPVLTLRESMRAGETVTIMAGGRDSSFFGEGWSAPITSGNVTTRVSRANRSVVLVPLERVDDYHLTVRLNPFPYPSGDDQALPTVLVYANQNLVTKIDLRWNPERVGSYDFDLPRSLVRRGNNRLTFSVDGTRHNGATFALWYVQVLSPAARR